MPFLWVILACSISNSSTLRAKVSQQLLVALVLLVVEAEGAQVAAVLALLGGVEVTGHDGDGLIGVPALRA